MSFEAYEREKERGTLATLLVTPLGRSELAVGKILSLATLAFLSGLVNPLVTVLSMPKLLSGTEDMIVANICEPSDFVILAFVILLTVLLLVKFMSVMSAFAKTDKEANMTLTPVMIVVMVVGVTGMFGGAQESLAYYIIPLYNGVQSMNRIFSLDYSPLNIALASLSNLAYVCLGGFLLTKMFNNEKVVFSR